MFPFLESFLCVLLLDDSMPAKKKPAKKEPLPRELYNMLACPECKSVVRYNASKTALVCAKCRENYPIRDGIPVMLPKSMR
jgi:uncharacterized protein YbaR (Trm112 family)